MNFKMKLAPLLTVALFITSSYTQNNPLKDPNICGRPTCKNDGKFRYLQGVEHRYIYLVDIKSLFNGTSKNESTLYIRADALIDIVSDCDGLLTLTDVKMSESPDIYEESDDLDEEEDTTTAIHENSEIFADALQEFTLRFAFHDGVISEVCPDLDEKNWVLNFKKGLLSMLHNTMKRFDLDHHGVEEDIHGKCEAAYKVLEPDGTSLVIEKTKDLTSCESRSKLHSVVQSTSYNFRPNSHETKPLKSSSKCIVSIDHYIYKEVTCFEKHLFQPFSNQDEDAGAMTVVKQNLRLVEEVNKILDDQMSIQRRKSLVYDPVPTPKPITDELKKSRDLIKELCKLSIDANVQIEFSDVFTKFVHTARYLSYSALHVLYRRAGSVCPTGKKHVLDALPYLGTSAAVGIMRDTTLPDNTINEWMLSVALIPRPDVRMMDYLHRLLERNKLPSVSFAASTLTYTFCIQNDDCTSHEVIEGIILLLEDRVSKAYNSKKYDRKTQEMIIISLKSLSNIGIIREPFKSKLFEIIEDREVDVAIRVAAVETYRRSPCEESRAYFEELFRNTGEDTEVRIAAYLQVMRCPNYVVVSTIRHSLEVEEVNQVGSFIWSHLHNLLKSSIPSRVEIQGLLSDKELVKKFSSDVRKFSNNYEGSLYFDDYNVGANYESNVIFSPSSYIPRSAMLNLTVDLFGESINLLEVYGRFEGFEQRLESIFGPKGAFSGKNVKDRMSRMKWTRDIDDGSNMQSEIDKYSDVIDNNFDNPKINFGWKIFGNDVRYTTFNGDDEVKAALNNINPIEHLKHIFSGREIKYNKAAMFMDTSYTVPNGAGLPVTLNVVGTASVNMKILGKLNSTNFMKTKSLDLNANIQPNIALDIVGTMSVDAYYASTGIKLKTSLYTSSAIETSITMRGAQLIRVTFGVPKQTTEILGAKSELIVMKGSLEEMQSGIEKNKLAHSVCTWPAVDRAIGLKLCADYHFMNVTTMNNTPKFVLAGPSGFRLALQKIDPTARTYFMEYQWNVKDNRNYITFVLDTPGAQISRLLSINVTHNDETGNLTLQLFSTSGNVLAQGKYKNTDFEKYIDIGLDIDHQRKFGTHLSIVKQPINFGFNYVPKLIISVNNDNVAELQGTLKWVEKSGISQSDVNLKFKTKRLTSKLFGYISKTENSVGANLKLDYKFVNTRSETVRLDFSLADKSKRIIAKYVGQAQIQTTAYPNMNFNSSLQFQKAAGYTELDMKFECGPTLFYGNNKDPNGITTFKAFLAHRTLVNATKLQVDTTLTKPSAGWDLKGFLAYERMGHWVDTKMLIRYNTGREILIQAFWSNPKQVLDDIEARLNITVPAYTPMILKVKVKEQNFHSYAIDIDGVWFTGFTITMKGIYNYRNVVTLSQHHLKMMLRSPSFNEINADLQYYRDNKELKIDLKADHNNDAYEFYLKHIGESNVDMVTFGKIRYKAKMYSVMSSVSWKEEKYVKVELHLDQLRDIHLAMWGHNRATHKAVGYEIKWDANRDPNQKLVVTVDISNPAPYNYDGNFVVAYPGRTINGLYNFLWIAEKFSTLAHLAWSPEDAFTGKLSIDYRYTQETYIYLTSELLTPFDDVKRTALTFGYRHIGNMYRVNGSVHWQDNQHVSFDIFEDYEALGTYLQCEAKVEVSSTIADIPSVSASLKHCHNVSQVDSNLYVMYHPKQIIDLGSSWKVEVDDSMTNLTGTVTMLTPFRGLNKGLLVSKIYFTNSRNIRGVADLDVDHRKFRATVEGNLQKITRSMLKFDITTPFEKYSEISGRFGIMEEQRHVVCMVTSPTGSIGIEIKLLMQHFTHFDIIFNLATPIEFLQKILIVGKIEEEEADFRLGWNTLHIGFTGVWHYTNVTDFQHSYKIYTPIEGLEENGIVAKLMFKEGLDFEISIKLAKKRLGITVEGKPKPMILKELGIKTQAIYKEKLANDGDGLKQVTALVEEDPFSWEGFVEIDTLLYPTMKGTIDIDQKGTVYDILASLHLPNGEAELRNEFDFISIYKMKNRLYLRLPFKNFKTITSDCVLNVTPEHEYLASVDFNYQNDSQWIESGAQIHYIMPVGDENIYNLVVHLHTPSVNFPKLDLASTLSIDVPTYKLDFNMSTVKSKGSFKGKLRALENVLDTEVDLYVISPVINIPPVMFNFHKDFSETENKIGLYINTPRTTLDKINCTAMWNYESLKNFKANLELDMPKIVGKGNAEIEIHTSEAQKYAKANVQMMVFKLESFGRILGESLTSQLSFSYGSQGQNMTLDAILKPISDDKRQVEGVLILNGKAHNINGLAELREDILSNLQLEMSRKDGDNAPKTSLVYQLTPQSDGYDLSTTVRHGTEYATVGARTAVKHKYDWDLDLQVNTSHTTYNSLQVHAEANTIGANTSFTVDAKIPFADLGEPKLEISLAKIDEYYYTSTSYEILTSAGKCDAVWSWIFLENMSLKLNGNYSENKYNWDGHLNVFYVNPKKTLESLKIGGDLDLNKTWSVGSNLTLSLPVRNKMDVEANIKLSPYSDEVHSVLGKFYEENRYTQIEYLGKYKTNMAETIYGSNGKVSFTNLDDIYGDVDVVVGPTHINNYLEYKTENNVTNLYYRLRKPKYNEDTVRTYITYKKSLPYHNISCEVFHPGDRSVAKADIDFREFGNMNGSVNVTTPFPGFNYTGVHFITETNSVTINRFAEVFWVNKTAVLDSKCTVTKKSEKERDSAGVVFLEIPLAHRHIARLDYGYSEKPLLSTGQATVEYNGTKVLEGKYNCLSESKAGFDKDTIHVELENKLLPIGVDYLHGYEYGAPGDGSNRPTVDTKDVHIYNLYNKTALNVSGGATVKTFETGQDITLTATHKNRTVKLWTNYDIYDRKMKQYSRLDLAPTVWISYDINLYNKTVDETSEAQEIQINLSYPRRNFTALGSYNISEFSLSSEVSLEWDKERKTVQAGLDWKKDKEHPNHHELRLDIKHPSFEKNVSVLGEYESVGRKLADFKVSIDYSPNPEQLVLLTGLLENHSKNNVMNYTYNIKGSHPQTELYLDMNGGVFWRTKYFISRHLTEYNRTNFPQPMDALALVDIENNEIEFKRKTPTELTYLWSRHIGKFPLYTANISAIYGNDINASGVFYLNLEEKLVQLELNKTTDGSQSLHMYGIIPDARSAIFDIWRDYEDIRVFDVSYLLRLNHSRLLVANLNWRPELKQDIKNGIRSFLLNAYNSFTEGANNARQYVRSEMTDAISAVWRDCKPQIHQFLDDVKNLNIIADDIKELKIFLNDSYHANEFYIRDMVGFLLYTFDDLSIKSHLENLPVIVNEIWEAMGESGKRIQKSIVWVIEKIKMYYKNLTEFINGLLQGESLEHLSDTFQEFLEKYDNFIKEMHVSFIRYMEDLWNKTYRMLVNNWNKTLASIEPTLIKIAHYLEAILWNAGQEFMDFLYIRQNEIIGSEYFNKLANFTQDVDRFYKDITGNDTLGAIYKYSKATWNFVTQKYFELVPFAKELQQVFSEIVNEITELKKQPSIQFLIVKFDELYENAKLFYNYFDVQTRLHRFITLVRLKLTDAKQNALDAENRYREAKTKFIFEPADGIMYLEQKLPMSWHAFNETPKFDELSEYQTIKNTQKYFSISKLTLMNLYMDYNPIIEPSEWFPPFKAQAMLIRGRHYITFDRSVYDFRGECTYLLATDFKDSNFSIAVSYNKDDTKSYKLLILIEKILIQIDMKTKAVKIGNNKDSALPVQIEHAYVYQEADIIFLRSDYGFLLECNMKFDICIFRVSGWYFGKTAGLWGTMNNERYDDFLTSSREHVRDVETFTKSWSLDNQCSTTSILSNIITNTTENVRTRCESLFTNKVSPFVTCFPKVPPHQFLAICLKSTTEEEVCSSAVAYMSLCSYDAIPLRIPDTCVRCNLLNETSVSEGEFIIMEGSTVPRSADIVFIVEANKCNVNVRRNRKIDMIVANLEKELTALNIKDNRYSVLAFGNDNVVSQPRSIVINSTVFTGHQLIPDFFDHIKYGESGTSDVFQAIVSASKLLFRPGVSKTFILLPCTDCRESRMQLDYSILHQLLLENDITLHILMNEDFRAKKARGNKIFFGIDRTLAYTKKDVDEFKGDGKLRKEIQLPKTNLGFCMPLAMESNGAIFTGKKLETKMAARVASVFAKRIAKSAQPKQCKTCECTAFNTGVSYMECYPCSYPTPITSYTALNEDELLMVMQPGDNFEYDEYL